MFGAQEAGLRSARQIAAAFWSAALSAQAAGVTIALRLPILAQAATDPFAAAAHREARRAAVEKWEAALEGAFSASLASSRLWRDMFLRPGDMNAFARGVGAVARAASRPANRAVRDNARRLSQRRG